MKQFFFVILLSVLVVACGDPSSNRKVPFENITVTNYSNVPLFPESQIVDCHSRNFADNIQFGLHLFLNGKSTFEYMNFSGLIHLSLIEDGQIIARTVYGEKVEIIRSPIQDRYIGIEGPKKVSLCADLDQYEQGTIESAALNAAYFISKTNAKFKTAVKDINIRPITLNISPSILQSNIVENYAGEKIKESSYWTDNALYTPLNESITFLPHSQEMRKMGLTVNFWEVPMIASHEYGHHIYQAIFPHSRGLSLGCFDHLKKKTKPKNKSYGFRVVSMDDIMTAYNEAFADLISYYTLEEHERGVEGIMCLKVTRDVGSSVMINGKSKVITKSLIHSFFSFFEESSSCDYPSYQEVHILGASLAFSMDQLMNSHTSSKEEKLRILVAWVKDLKANHKKYKELLPRKYFENTMTAFIEMNLKQFHDQDQGCEAVKASFPGLEINGCSNGL
ncbi:hypothetical protein ACJVC5_00895 [Peredibacter sp. HCB2-198]|uniref:hypothetical protein n=1 Tax=Peredibacter sp. HCB2-198 TaxID=3383025 RepID=UPI0038B5334D